MDDTVKLLMHCIRFEIKGEPIPSELSDRISFDVLKELFVLSKKHDLAHLTGAALEKNKLLTGGEIKKRFHKEIATAVYRFEQLNYEFNSVSETFENAKIPFMPLKGAVIRNYYPEPWIRTSCDIDILIHEEDIEKASAELSEKLSYKRELKGAHDISFLTPAGMHIELHYDLIEEKVNDKSGQMLKNVWDNAYSEENSVRFYMTDETFYAYHLAHMAKHFVIGGCGVRPFIDLWILNNRVRCNAEKRQQCIRDAGLYEFEKTAVRLSKVWFENAKPDTLTDMMENFIISGGVYGSIKNRVAIQQRKKGGKFRYIMSRLFLPYSSLKYEYPVLEKHKWLFPFMEVRRWFRLLFNNKFKRSAQEMRINLSISKQQQAENAKMLDLLGL